MKIVQQGKIKMISSNLKNHFNSPKIDSGNTKMYPNNHEMNSNDLKMYSIDMKNCSNNTKIDFNDTNMYLSN